MSEVSAALVRELRDRTGVGMMDCKRALAEVSGDIEKALLFLREKGLSAAAKKSGRTAAEGAITAYIHAGGKIGVLLEVNCETDFVARTDDFQNLLKDLAMQIAAANPRFVRREDVPAEVIEQERRIFRAQAANTGKPQQVVEKIVDGKIEKFFAETCLLEQPFIKEADKKVGQLITDLVARLGENLVVRRFARFQLGEIESANS
jgi:elongation factor Ts